MKTGSSRRLLYCREYSRLAYDHHMHTFNSLTPRGQIRRLRALALAALEAYPLTVRRLALLAVHTNTLFRVDGAHGDRYVLRISTPGQHSLNDNLIELAWLTALARDRVAEVVTPVANRSGAYLTHVALPTVPEERRCVLFAWVPGRPLATQLTPVHAEALGAIMAALHTHAATVQLPATLTPMTWHTVFYYHHEPVVIESPAYVTLFSPARRALIAEVAAAAEAVLQALAQSPQQRILIHGDLHPRNVHLVRRRLVVLDFEDVLLGYPVQDIAITFAALRHYADHAQLQRAFEAGYRRTRSWPVQSPRQLIALMAARDLMMLNYAAQAEANAEPAVERICRRLETARSRFGTTAA